MHEEERRRGGQGGHLYYSVVLYHVAMSPWQCFFNLSLREALPTEVDGTPRFGGGSRLRWRKGSWRRPLGTLNIIMVRPLPCPALLDLDLDLDL